MIAGKHRPFPNFIVGAASRVESRSLPSLGTGPTAGSDGSRGQVNPTKAAELADKLLENFILWVVKGNHTNPCSNRTEPKRGGVAKCGAAPGA